MPLTGEAKKLYQREYMRRYMRELRGGRNIKEARKLHLEEWNQDRACQGCGHYGVVDNHHIDKNHNNNGEDNRIFLCPNCHALIHRRGKTLEEIVKTLRPAVLPTTGDVSANPSTIDADGNAIPDYD